MKHKDDELAFLKDFKSDYDDIDEEFTRLCSFQPNPEPVFANQDEYQEILKDPIIQEQLQKESRIREDSLNSNIQILGNFSIQNEFD